MTIRRLLAAVLLAVLAAGCGDVGPDRDQASPARTTTTTRLPLTTEATTAGPSYDTPRPAHFKLRPKVLESESFGSAGALITVRVVAGWERTYDPAKTYEVTYEVLGGEDGPEVATFEVQGDRYDANEHTLETPSTRTRVRFRVLSVEEV